MVFFTDSRRRMGMADLHVALERLRRRYGDRWTFLEAATVELTGDRFPVLPCLTAWTGQLELTGFWVFAHDSSVDSFLRLLQLTHADWSPNTSLELIWGHPDGQPASEWWGEVVVELRSAARGVGIRMGGRHCWEPVDLLPRVIEAGQLPLEMDQNQGQVQLRHRHDPRLLYTPKSQAVRSSDWRCLFPGEPVEDLLARAARMVDSVAQAAVEVSWLFRTPKCHRRQDPVHQVLWEKAAAAPPLAGSYTVMLDLALTDLATLDALRSLRGRWSIDYWLASVDPRDEDGMPLGEDDDPMAPRYIRFGIETSGAGHRLLLESDAPFDLAALSALTGLSFQKWR